MDRTPRFLIVGQGLAGAVLAHTLEQRGCDFLLVDKDDPSSASRIAAGMWNPIVFKRVTLAWKAVELLEVALPFYQDWSDQLGGGMFHQKEVWRIFPDRDSAEHFAFRADQMGFEEFLQSEGVDIPDHVKAEHGVGKVLGGGFLAIKSILDAQRYRLKQSGRLVEAGFDEQQLEMEHSAIRWQDERFDFVVFCRGYREGSSALWGHLPFKPTKGEVLTIRCPGLALEDIVNNGKYLVPLGDDLFKVGATYDWSQLDTKTTADGLEEMLEKIRSLTDLSFEVVEHLAGIRPTISDRQPLVGRHPDNDRLAILNGLGTRGVMAAPWLAAQLCDNLLHGQDLNREIDIRRFSK